MLDLLTRMFRTIAPPEFTVAIRDGKAEGTQGKVPSRALSAFAEVAKQQNISKGTIYGVRRGNDIVLEFSGAISDSDQQRFRNAWNVWDVV